MRKHVAVVYQFARQADDIADEGIENSELRIAKLDIYESNFDKCLCGEYKSLFWQALHNTILEFNLNPKHFLDLISAFKQDVIKNKYLTFHEILDYCSRSANPVGRIMLEFFDIRDEKSFWYSDAICTALQLTNFYQDVSVDILKGRIYLPVDEIENYGVTLKQFELKENNTNFEKLLKHQIDRTKEMFVEGRKLIERLPSGLKPQIKMTILGGEKILERIENINYGVLNVRPKLTKRDYIKLFFKALILK